MIASAKKEIAICAAIAAAGFVSVFFISNRPETSSERISDDRVRHQKLTALKQNPAGARARNLIDSNALPSDLWAALDACDNSEFQELLSYVIRQPYGYLTAHLILAKWCERDPEAAVSAAAAARFPNSIVYLTAVELWGELDAGATLDYLNRHSGHRQASAAYHSLLGPVAENGNTALQPLLDQLPPERQSVKLHFELQEKAKLDPLEALRECATVRLQRDDNFEDRGTRSRLARPIIAQAISAGLAAEVLEIYSADKTRRLGDPPSSIIRKIYDDDPAAAIAWITDPSAPRRVASHGYRLARELGSGPPEKVADLLVQLPAGQRRSEKIRSLAERWSNSNPDAVREWAKELDKSDRKAIETMLGDRQP